MRRKTALKQFQKLINEVDNLNETNRHPWLNETISLIKTSFGEESLEERFFSKVEVMGDMQRLEAAKPSIKDHLQRCANKLRNSRMYRSPKVTIFTGIDQKNVYLILAGILVAGYSGGRAHEYFNRNLEHIKLENQNEALKASRDSAIMAARDASRFSDSILAASQKPQKLRTEGVPNGYPSNIDSAARLKASK